MPPCLEGDLGVGAVAVRYRPQDCEDVRGGERDNSLVVVRHRTLQFLLVVLYYVSTDALTATLLCGGASACTFWRVWNGPRVLVVLVAWWCLFVWPLGNEKAAQKSCLS